MVTGCLPLQGLTCEKKTESILVKAADLYSKIIDDVSRIETWELLQFPTTGTVSHGARVLPFRQFSVRRLTSHVGIGEGRVGRGRD